MLSFVLFYCGGFEVWTKKRKDGEKHYRLMPMSGKVRRILVQQVTEAREADAGYVFFNPNTMGGGSETRKRCCHFLPKLCERAGLESRYTLSALRLCVSHEMLHTDHHLKEI